VILYFDVHYLDFDILMFYLLTELRQNNVLCTIFSGKFLTFKTQFSLSNFARRTYVDIKNFAGKILFLF
jgi:ribonuclease D